MYVLAIISPEEIEFTRQLVFFFRTKNGIDLSSIGNNTISPDSLLGLHRFPLSILPIILFRSLVYDPASHLYVLYGRITCFPLHFQRCIVRYIGKGTKVREEGKEKKRREQTTIK